MSIQKMIDAIREDAESHGVTINNDHVKLLNRMTWLQLAMFKRVMGEAWTSGYRKGEAKPIG